ARCRSEEALRRRHQHPRSCRRHRAFLRLRPPGSVRIRGNVARPRRSDSRTAQDLSPGDPAGVLVEHHLSGTRVSVWSELQGRLRALTGLTRVLLIDGDWAAAASPQAAADVDVAAAGAADVVRRLRGTALVSIAVLRGAVTGPALRLALACTLRVAAPGTVLRVAEVTAGAVPAPDVLAALRAALGPAGAVELA